MSITVMPRERERVTHSHTREVLLQGTHISIEKNSVKSWQKGAYGKRVGITAPGAWRADIERESSILKGYAIQSSYTELPTKDYPLTSQCLCGYRNTYARGQMELTCAGCLLGPLSRDAYSALKARLIGENGGITLDAGSLNTPANRALALSHCGVPAATLVRTLTKTLSSSDDAEGEHKDSSHQTLRETLIPEREFELVPDSEGLPQRSGGYFGNEKDLITQRGNSASTLVQHCDTEPRSTTPREASQPSILTGSKPVSNLYTLP